MIFSPTTKSPSTEYTSRIFVVLFQVLTLATVPLVDPVTVSLKVKLPVDAKDGFEIVTVGATLYPRPALMMLIAVIVPAALTVVVAAAPTVVTPLKNTSLENVIVGDSTYPLPPEVTVIMPTMLSPINVVAAAPDPPPPVNLTPGDTVYPDPGFIISTFWTDFVPGAILSRQAIIPPIKDAVAIPVTPPVGAEDIATVGIEVYPPPLFVTEIERIPPLISVVIADAVLPTPASVSEIEEPIRVEIPYWAQSIILISNNSVVNFIYTSVYDFIFISKQFASQLINIIFL